MKKFYLFGFYYLSLLFMEGAYSILIYDNYTKSGVINVLLFMLLVAVLLTILTSFFKDKLNKLIAIIIFAFLGLWYNIYYVFRTIFSSSFSLSIFKLSDQGLKFAGNGLIVILQNIYGVVIFFLPLLLIIFLRKKLDFSRVCFKKSFLFLPIIVGVSYLFVLNINMQKKDRYSIYDLYFNINDNDLNIQNTGVFNASILDIERTLFGFEEKILVITSENEVSAKKEEEIFTYGNNVLDIDLDAILSSNNNEVKSITNYLLKDTPTSQNKYTGIFKNKNLIYITAESFSGIAVSAELTPTLYKLINAGFRFTNYYSSNNLSTIGGEFQSLTGLYANNSILSNWRSGKNYFPYGLANAFRNVSYKTYAYHNHYATFQDRDKYLKAMGFDNYLACYNGMEKLINCKQWPESDVEMIEATTNDYLNSESPFLAYYMTVSGHFAYNWGNKMALKHKEEVIDLPYSEPVKAYIATQIELDEALELLIEKLKLANKLDETVIVLLCDHYPYGLTIDEINELSSYERDKVVEINKNNVIIWNSKIKQIDIDKPMMSIDVIPTVYNLFGIPYDSRLFMGKDIFSDSIGLAFFKNRSWVTEKGTYLSSSNEMISTENVGKEYIDNINNIVANRMNISRLIIKNNYYNLFK